MVHSPEGTPITMLGSAMPLGIALNTCAKVFDKVATCCVCGVVVGVLSSLVKVVVGVAVVVCS